MTPPEAVTVLSDSAVRAQLRSVLQHSSGFEDLVSIAAEPPLTAPDPDQVLHATLTDSRLTIYDLEPEVRLTLNPIATGSESGRTDAGKALPNGIYYVAHEPAPNGLHPIFRVQRKSGTQRFTAVRLELLLEDADAATFLAALNGRGMLFYNNTARTKPLFGFLSYEIQESQSYEILFIDLCVNFARNQLERSRVRMTDVADSAGNRDAVFQEMVTTLRAKAEMYYRLEGLRDFLNLLSYLRYLSGTGWVLSLQAEKRGYYQQLIEETIPAMEEQLAASESPLTLNDLIEEMDAKLRHIRRGAPLLGRLRWQDIRDRSDAQIATAVRAVIDDLLEDNGRAAERLDSDMENVRRLLSIVPPRVMSVPRIFGTIERAHAPQITSNAYYFWAVQRLKSNAAGFSLMLGLSSAAFSFFCPPAGVALGIFSAVVSVDQAIFHDVLSDSAIGVDETFITQSEARESAFWAALDVLFAAVDVGTLRTARSAVRSIGIADELGGLPRTADELAAIGGSAAPDARTLSRMAEATEPGAQARAATVVETDPLPVDLGRVDHSRSRQISAPGTAEEAIAEASPVVRQSIERNLLPLVDDAYVREFERLRELGQNPLRWEEFATGWYAQRVAAEPPVRITRPPRDGFYAQMAGGEGRLREILVDPATFRRKLIQQLERGGIPAGMSGFDDSFLARFRARLRAGDTPELLDDLVQREMLAPIDQAAEKAGYAAGNGREFGLFAQGTPNLGKWDESAFQPLRRLFENTDVDRGALHEILVNSAYRARSTPRFNMEVIVALDRITGVEGVLTRVNVSNPPLIQSLARGNRGHGFEAIILSRILDQTTDAGATVSVGRRWWLREIERLNTVEGTTYGNVLEADILITHADGRRVLVDTKFFHGGISITESLDTQLAKIATGIEEGLIHNAEYWVSHHFTRSREGLTNLEAFQTAADFYSSSRIHLVHGVYEAGFPEEFLRSSRFTQVSRGDAIHIPPSASDLGLPGVSGSATVPAGAVTPPPNAIVPVAESIGELIPSVRQSDVVRESSTLSRDLRTTYVPLQPIASTGRVTVKAARVGGTEETVRTLRLGRFDAETMIDGERARDFARTVVREVARDAIRRALSERDEDDNWKVIPTNTIITGGEPADLYTIAFEGAARITPGTRYQLALYSDGDLIDVLPAPDEGWLLLPGWNAVPLTAIEHEGEFIYPHRPGHYQWVLRVQVNGRYLVHGDPLPMAVLPRSALAVTPGLQDADDDE